jgi:hypothetical protein
MWGTWKNGTTLICICKLLIQDMGACWVPSYPIPLLPYRGINSFHNSYSTGNCLQQTHPPFYFAFKTRIREIFSTRSEAWRPLQTWSTQAQRRHLLGALSWPCLKMTRRTTTAHSSSLDLGCQQNLCPTGIPGIPHFCGCTLLSSTHNTLIGSQLNTVYFFLDLRSAGHPYCKREYGLGSQCRPNECLFWVWETPGGRDFG